MNVYKDLESNRCVTEDMFINAIDNKYFWEYDRNNLTGVGNRLVTSTRGYNAANTSSSGGSRLYTKSAFIPNSESLDAIEFSNYSYYDVKIHKILKLSDGTFMVSGNFSSVSSDTRFSTGTGCVARFSANGKLLKVYPFSLTGLVSDSGIFDMLEYDNYIVCVGRFSSYDATSIGKSGYMGAGQLAIIDLDGNLIGNATFTASSGSPIVRCIDRVGANDPNPRTVILGGKFNSYNGISTLNVVIDNDLLLSNPFNPSTLTYFGLGTLNSTQVKDEEVWSVYADKDGYPLSPNPTTFYAGISRTNVSLPKYFTQIVRLTASGGVYSNFNATFSMEKAGADNDESGTPIIYSMGKLSSGTMVVGGRFNSYRNAISGTYTKSQDLSIINYTTGSAIYYFPDSNSRNLNPDAVRDIKIDSAGFTAVGKFSSINNYSLLASIIKLDDYGNLISKYGATYSFYTTPIYSVEKLPYGDLGFIDEDLVLFGGDQSLATYKTHLTFAQYWRAYSSTSRLFQDQNLPFDLKPHLPPKKVYWTSNLLSGSCYMNFSIRVGFNNILGQNFSDANSGSQYVVAASGTASGSGYFNVYNQFPITSNVTIGDTMRLSIYQNTFTTGAICLQNLAIRIKDHLGNIIANGTVSGTSASLIDFVIPYDWNDLYIEIGGA